MWPETPSDEQLEGSVWAPAWDPPAGGLAGALPWDKPAARHTGSVRRERGPTSGTRAGTPCAGACRELAAGRGPSALGAAPLSSHRRGGSRSLGRCGCPSRPADPRLSPDSRWVDPSSRCCPWTRRHPKTAGDSSPGGAGFILGRESEFGASASSSEAPLPCTHLSHACEIAENALEAVEPNGQLRTGREGKTTYGFSVRFCLTATVDISFVTGNV